VDRSEWGIKRCCLICGTRFYDFNNVPILCPECNAIFDPEYLAKRKTKNSHERVEDPDVGASLVDNDLPPADDEDDDIVSLDNAEDIPVDDSKE
jgi:uncharacterized protein (TIGR02300 family)